MNALLSAIMPRKAGGRFRECRGFRSILCPVDFSEHSRLALECAAHIAARGHGSLTVMYVNDPLLVAAMRLAFHDRNSGKRERAELRAFVTATLGQETERDRRVAVTVVQGEPVDHILAAQRRHRSDLIVVGTHGYTGVGRVVLGSTALGLLQRTRVPVLAVPRWTKVDVSVGWPGDRIAAAIELDRPAAREVATAAHLARWFNASLLLVHVVPAIAAPLWWGHDLTRDELIRIGDVQGKLYSLAQRSAGIVKTEARVIYGQPADELAALVAAERSQLLITALRDRGRWFGARRGSVSYHVLTHSVAPVLAYPPQWRFR
jgi:nucleotide-binding universal stress UspA family protein